MESVEIHAMRNMAWERAKGELNSMLQTYYHNGDNYRDFKKAYEDFVKEVEDNGLQE